MAYTFFGTKSDPSLKKDMIIKSPYLYVAKQNYSGSGVCTKASNDITLTPAVSPVWSVNQHQSAAGLNMVVQGDGGKTFVVKVKSNIATAVVFDATTAVEVNSGAAGVAADFTTTSSYYFYLLTPHATSLHGNYFGVCKEIEVTPKVETSPFKVDIPEKTFAKDIVGVEWSMKGKNFNISNQDVIKTLWNTKTAGSQTNGWEEQFGGSPSAIPVFRLTAVGTDVEDREVIIQMFLGQFAAEGGLPFSGKERKGAGFIFEGITDDMRLEDADFGMMRREN